MAAPQLPPQARRIRVILVSLPIAVASGYVLYKRLVLGEQQRVLNRAEEEPIYTTLKVDGGHKDEEK